MKTHSTLALALSSLLASGALVACNPCATPTVPSSYVTVSNASGAPVDGLQVTAQGTMGTVTFNCGSQGSGSDAAASSTRRAELVPADGSSGAPIAGTRCSFAGGLGGGPITVRAQAPGYMPAERVVSMSELTMPTGCGFALSVSIVLQPQ